MVTNAQKMRWLRQRLTGSRAEIALINKIVEFVTHPHPVDIEKLRRSLHHQVCLYHLSRPLELSRLYYFLLSYFRLFDNVRKSLSSLNLIKEYFLCISISTQVIKYEISTPSGMTTTCLDHLTYQDCIISSYPFFAFLTMLGSLEFPESNKKIFLLHLNFYTSDKIWGGV